MINNHMKIGTKVMFSNKVVKQCGHSKDVADMRGEIIGFISDGKVARVDTHGTYPNEEGNSIRCIPTGNLIAVERLIYERY